MPEVTSGWGGRISLCFSDTLRRWIARISFRAVGGWLMAGCLAFAAVQPPPDADQHWAFQAPRSIQPPVVHRQNWVQTDLDRFILSRLESAGIEPAPPADPRTLLRRLSFDLTGLPPDVADVDAFTAELKRDGRIAVSRWIDRLLASPHYGERWGRHWLDLARFSDTKGYVYAREERHFVQAQAYRDWVIQAFNGDLPYDRFLLLQIAADQLVPERSPDLAAMGFITIGRRFLGVTHDIIDDRIDVVTRTTLGLTVACARCHDHKYDPIPTADYYSLYGVFHGADDRQVPLVPIDDAEAVKRAGKFQERLNQLRTEESNRLRSRVADYLQAQLELNQYPEEGFEQILGKEDINPKSVRRWRDFLSRTRATEHPIFAPWHRLSALSPADGPQFATNSRAILESLFAGGRINPRVVAAFQPTLTSVRDLPVRYGQIFADALRSTSSGETNSSVPRITADPAREALRKFLWDVESPTTVPDGGLVNLEYFLPTHDSEELWKLQGEVDRRWIELGLPVAAILTDRSAEPDPRIFRRGDPAQPGPEVPRQFLGILSGKQRQPFTHGSGRLELAKAIVDPVNPLTARVWVNRVWQHHFGVGLVATTSDFGLRAPAPSHPELLDWLARRLVAEGWSLKALHRLILNSAVYQTAHLPSPTADPENRLLGVFPGRRLEFEQVRDAMLATSGELDASMGGKPGELLAAENHRRTVYALVDRQFLPGVLRTFDFANPDLHVAVRHETTVPQQGLYFLNGPFAAQRARELAARTAASTGRERIRELYRRVLQRPPTPSEVVAGLRFIGAAESAISSEVAAAPVSPWHYGWGEYDEAIGYLKRFTALPHFNGTAWQGAENLPGGETGWAQLTAEGGHPGNDRTMACVRRWVAPRDLVVDISGTVRHEPTEGDGIRAFLVAGRAGKLHSANVHHTQVDFRVRQLAVQAGEAIDFIVDIGGGLGYDQFQWSPVIVSGTERWEARTGFSGPPSTREWLQPWEQYAQVLLLTNEFAFVD